MSLFFMGKKWNIEDLDTCYRQSVNSFCDGFDHAEKQNIPRFIEEYRLSRVKDAIAQWIVGEKVSGVRCQVLGETRQSAKGEGTQHRTSNNESISNGTRATGHGLRVLDIGCGHGWYCFRLIDKWNFEGNIIGVDISEHNISIFKSEIEKRRIADRLCAKVANAEELPFPDNQFDLVYSTEALEHIESPEKVFAEASRVLKAGGRLIITTPSGPIHRFWRVYFWLPMKIKRLFVPEKTPEIQKIYDHPLSWKRIKQAVDGKDLGLIHYHKAVLLPHESYIQFFPGFMQRFILFKAKFLELFGPLTSWMGLHHIAVWRKK